MILSETIHRCFQDKKAEIIQAIIQNHSAEINQLTQPQNPIINQNQYLQETDNYLNYLKQSLLFESPILFLDYISSISIRLKSLKIPSSYIIQSLHFLQKGLSLYLPPELLEKSRWLIKAAIEQLKVSPQAPKSYVNPNHPHFQLAKKYIENLLQGNRNKAKELILEAIKNGISIKEIYLYIFEPAQYEIGGLWQRNLITIADEHYCTASTQWIMTQLYPYIFKGNKNGPSVVAACIGDNLHELGIRMIADFLEMENWNTSYLGANVSDDDVIKILIEKKPSLFALSVTIPIQLECAYNLIQKIKNHEFLKSIKILVGGYTFNLDHSLWKKIGADGYAQNAEEAIKIAHDLMRA